MTGTSKDAIFGPIPKYAMKCVFEPFGEGGGRRRYENSISNDWERQVCQMGILNMKTEQSAR